jgi:hypothetical protein
MWLVGRVSPGTLVGGLLKEVMSVLGKAVHLLTGTSSY